MSIVTPIKNNLDILLTICRFEKCVWIPLLLVFVVAAGVGGKDFVDTPTTPATVAKYFSFGATIAGNMISWAVVSSDYTAYYHPRVSRFVKFHGGLRHDLISRKPAGECSYTRISASIFLP